MRKTLIRATVAATGALLLAGCGAQTVDIGKVEDNIKTGVKEQNDVDVDVNCPDSVDWKTGGTFTCDVVQPDGTKSEATVKMTSDDGEVEWKVGG
jgi:PBP1b-binding outer membrane lipoprotein LpoB